MLAYSNLYMNVFWQAQITALIFPKIFTIVINNYINFTNIISFNLVA